MITIAIQAGGASTRMGTDKVLLPFCSRPLVEHIIDQVKPIAGEILITSNHQDNLKYLGVTLVSDIIPGRGVLGGLYTSLLNAKNDMVAVIACDMPFVSTTLLLYEHDLMLDGSCDVAIPKTATGYEPLHAVFRRKTCLPAVYAALCSGEKRLISWFDIVKVQVIDDEMLRRLGVTNNAFENINTIVDLKKAEEKWRFLYSNE